MTLPSKRLHLCQPHQLGPGLKAQLRDSGRAQYGVLCREFEMRITEALSHKVLGDMYLAAGGDDETRAAAVGLAALGPEELQGLDTSRSVIRRLHRLKAPLVNYAVRSSQAWQARTAQRSLSPAHLSRVWGLGLRTRLPQLEAVSRRSWHLGLKHLLPFLSPGFPFLVEKCFNHHHRYTVLLRTL